MVAAFARLLLIGLLAFSVPASSDPTAAQSLEKSLRDTFKVAPDATVGYASVNGKILTPTQFIAELQQGSFTVITDKNLERGKTIFRLQKAEPAEPETGPSHLPPLDAAALDGRRFRNADLAGQPTLLSFFFSTCVPCIQEVPALNEFRRRHSGMNFLAITFDAADEARAFVKQRKLDWPVVADARRFVDASEVRGYPAYLLVAADGRIIARHTGLVIGSGEAIPGLASLEKWVTEASSTSP